MLHSCDAACWTESSLNMVCCAVLCPCKKDSASDSGASIYLRVASELDNKI